MQIVGGVKVVAEMTQCDRFEEKRPILDIDDIIPKVKNLVKNIRNANEIAKKKRGRPAKA